VAEKYTLRKYLSFMALIQRERNHTRAVDRFLREHPEMDESETRSWEGWRTDFTPDFGMKRQVDTAAIQDGIL
jgi:hypothetical protein